MPTRSASVYANDLLAGRLMEDQDGYTFTYDPRYLDRPDAFPVSASLPLSARPYHGKILFPFFRGLIPEGWLFDLNARVLKIDADDLFGMLLHTGRDCIGAITVIHTEEETCTACHVNKR